MERLRESVVVLATLIWGQASLAQPVPGGPSGLAAIPTRERTFRVPFRPKPAEKGRIREVQLFVSTDGGFQWQHHSSAFPEDEGFTVRGLGDGEYWFGVRTLDDRGNFRPASIAELRPDLRVRVDTAPPEIALRGSALSERRVGIEWNILETDLDLATIAAEYRRGGDGQWAALAIPRRHAGQATWQPEFDGPVAVRIRASDRAHNEGLTQITVEADRPPGAVATPRPFPSSGDPRTGRGEFGGRLEPSGRPASDPSGPIPQAGIGHANDSRPMHQAEDRPVSTPVQRVLNAKLVNATRFGLNYAVDQVGKSGLSTVALYYTYDGRAWELYGEDDDQESPFLVKVNGEGIYGFSLVARSGAGVGDDPPVAGEPPQVWVEVDLTPPDIKLYPPTPGRGAAEGLLYISWNVHDRNLAPKSIGLSYSSTANGPWVPIAANLSNTESYQWKMPGDVPYKFYVRIEALDRAGNIGTAQTDHPVIVDLARPRPKILGVDSTTDILSAGPLHER